MSLNRKIAAALSALASGIALPGSERATVDDAVKALDKQAEKDAKAAVKTVPAPKAGKAIPREVKPATVPATVNKSLDEAKD